jgi:phosphoribosyl-ATP pyrophosphohydrolase/phosphoribosyl-AMP cyclohydrolase
MGMIDPTQLQFSEGGLLPCVAQDAQTGEVLMLAWVNREAVDLTLSSGKLHFWSRSRSEIWLKGETSGNLLHVVDIRTDCDSDALLALVEPDGAACHTGSRTCFGDPAPGAFSILPELERTINLRASEMPDGSWTAKLLSTDGLAGEKVEEEAEEVVRAARDESSDRVSNEAADLIYHLLVLLRTRDISLADALRVLADRAEAQ